MSDESEEEPVGPDPEVRLIPHLFSADAVPSTQAEAHQFWLDGGWDDQAQELRHQDRSN